MVPAALAIAVAMTTAAAAASHPPPRAWMADLSAPPAQRAAALLAEMNATEKLWMLGGNGTMKPYVGAVTGNARLGIPDLTLNDGKSPPLNPHTLYRSDLF